LHEQLKFVTAGLAALMKLIIHGCFWPATAFIIKVKHRQVAVKRNLILLEIRIPTVEALVKISKHMAISTTSCLQNLKRKVRVLYRRTHVLLEPNP
jgi:hypothetical protein